MTRLVLIRHAKSDWSAPFEEDHARALTKRGRQAASTIGKWLQSKGYHPDLIMSSDATRTRQTCDHMIPQLSPAPTVSYYAALYHPSPDILLSMLTEQTAACIALVSHNPGIAILAHALLKSPPDHPRFDDYPTCATTVIDFAGQVSPGQGHCTDFIVPRDLTD